MMMMISLRYTAPCSFILYGTPKFPDQPDSRPPDRRPTWPSSLHGAINAPAGRQCPRERDVAFEALQDPGARRAARAGSGDCAVN